MFIKKYFLYYLNCMPKTARAILQMPPATVAAIEKLGADLAVARLRRKESLKTWAQRMGVSVPTLQRLEGVTKYSGIRFSSYRNIYNNKFDF